MYKTPQGQKNYTTVIAADPASYPSACLFPNPSTGPGDVSLMVNDINMKTFELRIALGLLLEALDPVYGRCF